MDVFYDRDADLELLKTKKIAIIGYGSQGHAQANNLKDSGCDVVVGLRPGSPSRDKAEAAGLEVINTADAAMVAEVVMMLVPDELAPGIYKEEIEPNLRPGNYLAFAHGFSVHFQKILPPEQVNVFMVAPKAPGVSARAALHYAKGELRLNEKITIESILGSTMAVQAVEVTKFGPYDAVIPEVSGTASITGRNEFYFDPEDPFRNGFIFR